jgi:hypothetical protein
MVLVKKSEASSRMVRGLRFGIAVKMYFVSLSEPTLGKDLLALGGCTEVDAEPEDDDLAPSKDVGRMGE